MSGMTVWAAIAVAGMWATQGTPDHTSAQGGPAPKTGPEADYDQDTVPNLEDDCPTDPGSVANRGCPGDPPRPGPPMGVAAPQMAKKNPLAQLRGSVIALSTPILFRTGSAALAKGNAELLDAIAEIVRSLPDHKRVIVRGHTDNVGGRVKNLKLSMRRARTVKKALVRRKIERSRLRSDGVGPDVPIASNKTRKGRAKNRRVEFVVVRARR